MSSTPPRASSQAISSDSVQKGADSPPSSPPDAFPWEQKKEVSTSSTKDTTKQNVGPFKNVFSILGKRKALATASDNARPQKTQKAANDGLQQMQMSLGQKVQKKCDTCGMEYIASSAEDRKLHDKYHKQNVDGYDLGKDFVSKIRRDGRKLAIFKGVQEGDAIVYLDCFDNHHRRKKGQAVLEIVQRELGAVAIPEEELWDLKHEGHDVAAMEARYKSFLYVRETKCVGYLLVKNIQEAREVVRPKELKRMETKAKESGGESEKKLTAWEKLKARKQQAEEAARALKDEMTEAASHPLQLDDTTHSAVMGISRIWTSSSFRSQGIAQCLLNTAINRNNSMVILNDQSKQSLLAQGTESSIWVANEMWGPIRKIERKQDVAFSQPTEAGAKLARKWFGRAYGWRVYVD
ncbi:Putative N-acetyltransferase ESCO, zinc-finger, N-acetyltransferase ESCO, acetyl-transferase [Septoria linicola]|uniref:N-acetyltransferase ESCO, zinc-finger, N-acetyltransferase ESCO, acetyl-transferase n=1 Tax=Septoria linicola TaxID=215465 RepID=A0A9Q9EQL7_9PEZI|nr:putative N-acetyltransferase ESCO, zinc-finger, N-acetyltransferase ESCO, acetyl-transferase [Septoria linicola]USW58937.1 Putative N-acetyltransferase ESCO, zinc-finger, N-acetyltransferase ESCO, acetyl-transferase [Septoria linicola]